MNQGSWAAKFGSTIFLFKKTGDQKEDGDRLGVFFYGSTIRNISVFLFGQMSVYKNTSPDIKAITMDN